jgi:hypothetical protein
MLQICIKPTSIYCLNMYVCPPAGSEFCRSSTQIAARLSHEALPASHQGMCNTINIIITTINTIIITIINTIINAMQVQYRTHTVIEDRRRR